MLTVEAVNNSLDKLCTVLVEPAEEELDVESSGLMEERSEFEFSGSVAMLK